MIVNDHRSVAFAGALALGCLSILTAPASAAEIVAASDASTASAPVAYVTLVRDGVDYTYYTKTHTVGDFLKEREIASANPPTASVDADDAIVDGMKIVLRDAPHARVARYSGAAPRRTHVVAWTTHRVEQIAVKIKYRSDFKLGVGTTAVVDAGRPGVRVTTYRFVRHGNDRAIRTTLASRIVRAPRVRVVARGVSTYASLARVAEAGFASAVRFAGSAFHMIATAYTAGCYGCSGITASGVRAGFGVIAVDPRVIPLGTKLFIPGYGRAVAGDTGGAILGNRVDLGMATQGDAIRYGRRQVTVYVLR